MKFLKQYDVDSIDNRDPELIEKTSAWINNHWDKYFKSDIRGMDRIRRGAGLFVGNHNAGGYGPDAYYFLAGMHRVHGYEEVPYGLMHEQLIQIPIQHQITVPLGAVRASHDNAHRLFARNSKALVYPGGDLDAYRPYRNRNKIVFGGRTGYIRLALLERVPIYPLVAAGAHASFIVIDDLQWLARLAPKSLRSKVWPLIISMPWGLTLGPFILPPIPFPVRFIMEVLEPVTFETYGKAAAADTAYVRQCADKVETAMQQCLDKLAGELKKHN